MKCLVVSVVVLFGCGTERNAQVCDETNPCPAEGMAFCDLDGSVDGTPNRCIADDCTAGQAIACRGTDHLLTCNSDGHFEIADCPFGCADGLCVACTAGDTTCSAAGNVETCQPDGTLAETTCANGCTNGVCNPCVPNTSRCGDDGNVLTCSASGTESVAETCPAGCTVDGATPRCKYLQPQFLPDVCDSAATTDLTVSTNQTIDTSSPTNCTAGVVNGLCVLHYKAISIASGATLRFLGSRPVALVADNSFASQGVLDVGGHGIVDGPGPNITGAPPGPGVGGGGFTQGGQGCDQSNPSSPMNVAGDSQQSDPTAAAMLAGGRRGGTIFGGSAQGGGGGGALTLIVCHGGLDAFGTINANGGGGSKSANSSVGSVAGGGGGGGTVVVQALSTTTGLSPNLAGGGGGGSLPGFDGHPGPTGGGSGNQLGGDGGFFQLTASSPPKAGMCTTQVAGTGGGGAAGFAALYTVTPPTMQQPFFVSVRSATTR